MNQNEFDYEIEIPLFLLEHKDFVNLSEKGKIDMKLNEKEKIFNLLFKNKSHFIINTILTFLFISNLFLILILSFVYNKILLWGYLGIIIGFTVNIISISSPILKVRLKRSLITSSLYVLILIYILINSNFNLDQYYIDHNQFNVTSYVIICSFIQFLNNNLTSYFTIEVVIKKLLKDKMLYDICLEKEYIELFHQKQYMKD